MPIYARTSGGVYKTVSKILTADGSEIGKVVDSTGRIIYEASRLITVTGVPPISFTKSIGKPLISWSMLGNAQQTGTPSPDNIIMPTLCGVRTGNLMFSDRTGRYTPADAVIDQTQGRAEFTISRTATENDASTTVNISLPLKAGTYTLSVDGMKVFERNLDRIFLRDENNNVLVNNVQTGIPHTFTLMEDTLVNKLSFVFAARSTYSNQTVRIMLNTGTTALPYEPYGYKIPFTNASQTVPVYLGQTQTVRRVKKLVLTGDEYWRKRDTPENSYYCSTVASPNTSSGICTHFEMRTRVADLINGTIYFGATAISARLDSATTVNDFKSYLAAQYAAGTPVTVWYVLATPETGIVNEPLAKIGDYADELHSTDAGVAIPTTKGNNTLTVDTDLPPSSMTIVYKGR